MASFFLNTLRCSIFICLCLAFNARADGIYGNGVGARSMAMGGADVAWANDPLGAMAVNPAGLGFLSKSELDLGAVEFRAILAIIARNLAIWLFPGWKSGLSERWLQGLCSYV